MPCPISFMEDVEAAIAHGSGVRRAEMLRRVTDLFISRCPQYSHDEIALFDDVISLLADEIEVAARVTLATQLAVISNAPPKIINRLACDDAIDVAWPVLTISERVDEPTLVKSAMTKSQQHLLAICRRKSVSERVTDILVARGDRPVLANIAANPGARFSELGYSTLVERSDSDDDLIERIGLRTDIPRPLFLKLLTKASERVRTRLTTRHPASAESIRAAVTQAAVEIQNDTREGSVPYIGAEDIVNSLHKAGQLSDAKVAGFAQEGQFEATALSLAKLCGLPVEMIERAMANERTENVLIFVKAAGLSRNTAKAVLQLHAGNAPLSQLDMEQSLASFDRLKPAIARELVRFYQLRESNQKPQ